MSTVKQKALTYSQSHVSVSLPRRLPCPISMTFPGSPQPSQRAPLRHSKCHESQEDIWYLWYHTLGSCQTTSTCQKDFAEERQNYKRLDEGPLSNWISILLSYVPGFPGALVITKIGTAQIKQKSVFQPVKSVLLTALQSQFPTLLGCVFYTKWYTSSTYSSILRVFYPHFQNRKPELQNRKIWQQWWENNTLTIIFK